MVGGLYPNDGDGNAWGDPELGFPKPLAAAGYTLIDPGRYQNLTDDFSAHISEFKENGVEIVTGVVLPPDFTTFWTQAAQQGFRPKAATVGKALLFPEAIGALGEAGHNMSSEIWWSPSHPFTSSITGQTCGELAAAFTAATGQAVEPAGGLRPLDLRGGAGRREPGRGHQRHRGHAGFHRFPRISRQSRGRCRGALAR